MTTTEHGYPPDIPGVRTFSGDDARRALTRRWGLPNSYPRAGESPFSRCRVLFVDDDNDGKPIAFWIPSGRMVKHVGDHQ